MHVHGMSKDLICKKERIKRNNIIKQYNFDYITKEDIKKQFKLAKSS